MSELRLFVVFHKCAFDACYENIADDHKKYITLYGVRDRVESQLYNTIYESDLAIHNSVLQTRKYNEGTALYHIYANELFRDCEYIGLFQYDMKFSNKTIPEILGKIRGDDNCIFYTHFFEKKPFLGGQTVITTDYANIIAGLVSYNNHFGTNFTCENIIDSGITINNTFIMHKDKFTKMMGWLNSYFVDNIDSKMTDKFGCNFDPGHMIEALSGMFIALEIFQGSKAYKMDINHDHHFKSLSY